MFCRKCGAEIRPNARFCAKCGSPAPQPDDTPPKGVDPKINEMSLDEIINLANRYGEANDYQQQLIILQHAATLHPDVPGIYNLMGIAHRVLGDYYKAIECYKKASELEPENGVFMTNIAIAMMMNDKPNEALTWFEKGLPLLKKSNSGVYPSALGNYALALGKAGHAENAVHCLKEAARLGYSNADEMRKRLEELGIFYH